MTEKYPHDTIHTHSVEVEELIRALRCFPTDADQHLLEEFARRLFHKGHEAGYKTGFEGGRNYEAEGYEDSIREAREEGHASGVKEGIKEGLKQAEQKLAAAFRSIIDG